MSVITPTWQRHKFLLKRCLPSVAAQTYRNVEQIVVSDGDDSELETLLKHYAEVHPHHMIRFAQIPMFQRGGRWGNVPRQRALEMADGDFIAYLDDDDAYRPRHCAVLLKSLHDHPDAGFAYSKMATHGAFGVPDPPGTIIGSETLGPCLIGTPMIMHRRELLEVASWGPPDAMEDWRLVQRWGDAGVVSYHVDEVTVDVWPQAYREVGDDLEDE